MLDRQLFCFSSARCWVHRTTWQELLVSVDHYQAWYECPNLSHPSLLSLSTGMMHTQPCKKLKLCRRDLQLQGLVVHCVCHCEIPEKHLESCMAEFAAYKLGIMLAYLWWVLRSSAVVVPNAPEQHYYNNEIPLSSRGFVLHRPVLLMHYIVPVLPFSHIRLESRKVNGNWGAPWVDSHGLPILHYLQWMGVYGQQWAG